MKSVLNAKVYGEESGKELFEIEGEESGLRYDFTVPLARYVASNRDLPLPFKRYQIGNMWRKEEPQKMRYREGIQADIDIVGTKEIDADAEVIAAASMALEQLGIRNYVVVINSRQMLQKIMEYFKVPAEKSTQALRILDKLQKLSGEEILKQFAAAGIDRRVGEELLSFVKQEKSNDEKLQMMSANIPESKAEVDRMTELLSLLGEYKLNGRITVDLALARGLNYYTGFVWEFIIEEDGKRMPSIGAGGRYDNLIETLSKRSVPAVGSSLGISRIFDLIAPEDGKKTYAKVFIAFIGQQNRGYAISVANMLRGNGVYVDLNTTSRNLSKQMEYAGSLRIRNVLILGDKEREQGKVKFRNMETGVEELISIEEAIRKLKVQE
jgi:histidyl-tRNA synthetase